MLESGGRRRPGAGWRLRTHHHTLNMRIVSTAHQEERW